MGTRPTNRLDFEFVLNEKLMVYMEVGSQAQQQYMQRNVEIARHSLFADDPEKKASTLLTTFKNSGISFGAGSDDIALLLDVTQLRPSKLCKHSLL